MPDDAVAFTNVIISKNWKIKCRYGMENNLLFLILTYKINLYYDKHIL